MRDENKRVVWRIQEPPASIEAARDYSSIEGFGEMLTILPSDVNPSTGFIKAQQHFDKFLNEVRSGDFILWAGGDPASAFLMGLILGSIPPLQVKWLRWDRRTNGEGERTRHGYYTPVEMRT